MINLLALNLILFLQIFFYCFYPFVDLMAALLLRQAFFSLHSKFDDACLGCYCLNFYFCDLLHSIFLSARHELLALPLVIYKYNIEPRSLIEAGLDRVVIIPDQCTQNSLTGSGRGEYSKKFNFMAKIKIF